MADTFRRQYKPMTEERQLALEAVKIVAEAYEGALKKYVHPGRYFALANTALEESVMWATKAITE